MKYFNFEDFSDIDDRVVELPEDRGEPELRPIGRKNLEAEYEPNSWAREMREGGAGRAGRRSDPIAFSCIRDYEKLGLEDTETGLLQKGTVHAVPKLVWEGTEVSLELTMGENRQYVVRNLYDFCMAMELGSLFQFGKQFSMRCAIETFHEDSRPLIRFVMKRFTDVKSLERMGYNYSGNTFTARLFTEGRRGMNMTPESLDELFSMYLDQSVSVRWKPALIRRAGSPEAGTEFARGFDKAMYIRDSRPQIPLELEESGEGVRIRTHAVPLMLKGRRYLYLCFSGSTDCLWRCDGAYMRGMGKFLSALKQNKNELFVAEKDMARFCASVLPGIREFADFSGDTECLKRWAPVDMAPRIYLDSPSKDVIAAAAKGDYGGVLINLYTGAEEGEGAAKGGPKDRSGKILRNSLQEQRLRLRLERWFSEIDERTGVLYMKGDDDRIYDFIRNGQRELAKHAQLFVTDRFRRMVFPVKTKVAAQVSIDSQLLKVTFDFEGFPVDELLDALSSYRARRRYHRLADGAFLTFEEEELRDALEFADGMHLTKEELARGAAEVPKYRAMYLDNIMKKAETIKFDRDGEFRRLIREIHGIEDSELAPPPRLEPILRDYQKTGFRWLATMAHLGFGGVLADDMGLGKTIEVIALLVSEVMERGQGGFPGAGHGEGFDCAECADARSLNGSAGSAGQRGRALALVVCPASLVLNWEQELLRFGPELTPYPVMGTAAERRRRITGLKTAVCRSADGEAEAEGGGTAMGGGELNPETCVVVTSYDLLKRDLPLYEGIPFHYHIVDEAQYIKNYSTQNAKAVKGVDSLHRFALTGTPVENRLSELWSIFDFLMPDFLGPYAAFKEEYELPILRDRDDQKTELLRGQIMPFVLRRLKRRVLAELPEKVESVVCVPMASDQRKIYLSNLAKVKLEIGREIREGGFESNKIQILAMLTRLRQICCHPALCYENYTKESGKLEACIELIREAVDGGHRVLLFSQFTSMFPLIGERLRSEKIGFYTLTGRTSKTERQGLVNRFNEGGTPVFLISLKAGGTGLNLTGADVVVHYDPWWNQAAQNQATDRAYRMGQKNSVQVYKLVAQDTIEEKIVKLQETKSQLADSVVGENSTLLSALDEKQLQELFL